MKDPLHCLNYDIELKASLKHLVNYPELLPFIGNSWGKQNSKIMFIAESHYLPACSNGKSSSETWYQNESSFLSKTDRNWIHTRDVVIAADYYALHKRNYAKGHSIFYNIKAAIFDAKQISKKRRTVFQNFGYYNYFQRPAEKKGGSINNSGLDNRVAYNTLKTIAECTRPTDIIFLSKKAFNSFRFWFDKEKDAVFNGIIINHIPHPASAWWNKQSKVYENLTGRQKFINIIKNRDFSLD